MGLNVSGSTGQDSRGCQRPEDTRRLGFPLFVKYISFIHCFTIVYLSLESQILSYIPPMQLTVDSTFSFAFDIILILLAVFQLISSSFMQTDHCVANVLIKGIWVVLPTLTQSLGL